MKLGDIVYRAEDNQIIELEIVEIRSFLFENQKKRSVRKKYTLKEPNGDKNEHFDNCFFVNIEDLIGYMKNNIVRYRD